MCRLLSVVLVSIYTISMCTGAHSASKAALPRDYGVKLCGREFIRAVIFTCGGSRWKRSVDLDLTGSNEINPFLLSSYSNPKNRDDELSWSQSLQLAAANQPSLLSSSASSPSLSELLQAMDDQAQGRGDLDFSEGAEQGGVTGWLGALFSSTALEGDQARSTKITWPHPDRKKRNFSVGVAGMCCNQGCTKNDIGRLC
ncbi:prorelaxin H1 [Chanos chanos]|uniref:Prorelaxin H1 n=1 Tax=Chanos chanos TaxID=29144 RepID=A0A6J2V0B8_CHACN|nr:relaxin-3-like [Chanos chanos]